MRKIQLGTAITCVVFAGLVMHQSLKMQFYTRLGPGPGFFPFILAGIFGGLALAWFVQAWAARQSAEERSIVPEKDALLRVASILVCLGGVAYLMEALGFQLAIFLFLFLLTRFLGKQPLIVTTLASLAGSFGVFHTFSKMLDVPLPSASIHFLASFGL